MAHYRIERGSREPTSKDGGAHLPPNCVPPFAGIYYERFRFLLLRSKRKLAAGGAVQAAAPEFGQHLLPIVPPFYFASGEWPLSLLGMPSGV